MKNDPMNRQARGIVRLVLLAVALPSLALTAMGVLAVHNEEAAARRRIEQTYKPVAAAAASAFNSHADALLAETEAPLRALVALATGADGDTGALARFVAAHPYATSFFVISADGAVLWPRALPSAAQPHGPTMAELSRLLAELNPELAREGAPADPDRLLARGLAVAHLLDDPRVGLAPGEVEALADRLAARVQTVGTPAAAQLWLRLRAIASRGELAAYVSRLARPRQLGPVLASHSIGDWRRLLLLRDFDGHLAGFELFPLELEAVLARGLEEFEDANLEAELFPVQLPKSWDESPLVSGLNEHVMKRMLAWVLLKKTDLAWELVVFARDESPLASLTHNRSRLYLWALVLIVGALVAGIVLTLRAVVREARVARLKTDFVSSVSHDLRTPLTSIRMFTETLLLGRVQTREEEQECLRIIAQETERLTRLTERILDFSRMEAGRRAYAFAFEDAGSIVRHAVAACRPLLEEHGFVVKIDVADDLPPIHVDRDAMVEVVMNLLTNAVKYSPGETEVHVSARREGDGVGISVADRGIGIAKAEQGRIFEKFYRVDCRRTAEVGGCGIGLSLVEHIIGAHGGRVTVDSTPGRGSIFTLHLPPTPAGAAEGIIDGEHPDRRGRSVHRPGPAAKPAV